MILTASFLSLTGPPCHLQSYAYTQKQGGSSGVPKATLVKGASHPCLLPVGEVVCFLLNREGGRLRVSSGSEGQARIKPNPIKDPTLSGHGYTRMSVKSHFFSLHAGLLVSIKESFSVQVSHNQSYSHRQVPVRQAPCTLYPICTELRHCRKLSFTAIPASPSLP